MSVGKIQDIIILIPGILGSELSKDGHPVWGLSSGAVFRGLKTLGGTIKSLILASDSLDDDSIDGVTADRLLPDAHLIPGFWKIDGYGKIAETLKSAFSLIPGKNYFELPYDWRRDNRVAARTLAYRSHKRLKSWREQSGNTSARMILLCHSMGGIIARHFLEVLDGWKDTRMAITFGTPFRGSLKALNFLANGLAYSIGPLALFDLTRALRSFTSVYQLLPLYPCYDPGTGNFVRVSEAAIPGLDAERVARALAFHKEISDAVSSHLKDHAYWNAPYRLHPLVGINQPTPQSARLTDGHLRLSSLYNDKEMDGDGTVPRVSATPLDLSNQQLEVYASECHASLQNSERLLLQVQGLISGLQLDQSVFKAPEGGGLSLAIADAFSTEEAVYLRVKPDGLARLSATITNVDSGQVVARSILKPEAHRWFASRFAPMSEGIYRVRVEGSGAVEPVTDLFAVFPS
jgi:Lecithin:cholesterol acyltransferase